MESIDFENVYKQITEKVNKLRDILNNYFGEERVDVNDSQIRKQFDLYIQDNTEIHNLDFGTAFTLLFNQYKSVNIPVTIYFPEVTVTNEFDHSIDIQDVFVRFSTSIFGTISGTFEICRTSYPINQFICGYCHSHVPCFSSSHAFDWKLPCLGTGPIKTTITTLNTEFNEDLWNLFCVELDSYLKTESIEGVPYIKMSSVTAKNNLVPYSFDEYFSEESLNVNSIILKHFIKSLIKQKVLSFGFCDNHYYLAYSIKQFTLFISDLFIKYLYTIFIVEDVKKYIDTLINNNTLLKIYYNREHQICTISSSLNETINELKDKPSIPVLTFKKQIIYSKIDTDIDIKTKEIGYILSTPNVMIIKYFIENLVNCNYGTPTIQDNSQVNKKIIML